MNERFFVFNWFILRIRTVQKSGSKIGLARLRLFNCFSCFSCIPGVRHNGRPFSFWCASEPVCSLNWCVEKSEKPHPSRLKP